MGQSCKSNNTFLAVGLGLGFALGFVVSDQLKQYKKLSPEKALQQAKETFQQQGPINGSWIYMKPETIEKNGLLYDTYRGGVSRNIDGNNKQYDFYVDSETGVVVDVKEIAE